MPKNNSDYGLLIDYEFCTGCHSCEVACAQEYKHKVGVRGIKVFEVEQKKPDGSLYLSFFPFPTETCILCPHRTREGLDPACVQHCMASCMKFGRIEDLAKDIGKKSRMVLWKP